MECYIDIEQCFGIDCNTDLPNTTLIDNDLNKEKYQFAENEIVVETSSSTNDTIYSSLSHKSPFYVNGTIYCDNKPIQTFILLPLSNFFYTEDKDHAKNGEINLQTNEISLHWNKVPGKTHLIVYYEYESNSNVSQP
jgi:hypothetical protein